MDASRFKDLQSAYLNTDYKVLLDMGEHLMLRPGEISDAADSLLDRWDVRCGAFLTPENPGSELLSDEENYERCVAFERVLVSLQYRWLHGTGVSRDGSWPGENSYFIPGMEEHEALRLACAFGQHAIIVYDRGTPARLVWGQPPSGNPP
jgi:hypothetical protein